MSWLPPEENGESWSRKKMCCAPVGPIAGTAKKQDCGVHQGAPLPCRSPSAWVPALSPCLDP